MVNRFSGLRISVESALRKEGSSSFRVFASGLVFRSLLYVHRRVWVSTRFQPVTHLSQQPTISFEIALHFLPVRITRAKTAFPGSAAQESPRASTRSILVWLRILARQLCAEAPARAADLSA